MDTNENAAQGAELARKPQDRFSAAEIVLLLVVAVYLIHVLMGWTYALFWWPLQS